MYSWVKSQRMMTNSLTQEYDTAGIGSDDTVHPCVHQKAYVEDVRPSLWKHCVFSPCPSAQCTHSSAQKAWRRLETGHMPCDLYQRPRSPQSPFQNAYLAECSAVWSLRPV